MTDALTIPGDKSLDPEEQARISKKFELWCNLFMNKKSDTYGNATQSAIKAYKLKAKQYSSAGVIGHENLKKLKGIGLRFEENDGRTVQDWYKILASKALKGSYEQTIDFMQKMGFLDKDTNIPANQNNVQVNFGNLAEQFAQARKERGLDKIKPIEEIPDAE
jgi:hypothetical protein